MAAESSLIGQCITVVRITRTITLVIDRRGGSTLVFLISTDTCAYISVTHNATQNQLDFHITVHTNTHTNIQTHIQYVSVTHNATQNQLDLHIQYIQTHIRTYTYVCMYICMMPV